MKRLMSFAGADRNETPPRERVVNDGADAPDCKGENQTLDIEPRALGELEKTGRVPVRGNEKWLGQAEERGNEARAQQPSTLSGVPQIEHEPWQQEGA